MKIWKRDYYEKMLGIGKPKVEDEVSRLQKENEALKAVVRYIFLCNPYPDLSTHKYRDAFRILEARARKVLDMKDDEDVKY